MAQKQSTAGASMWRGCIDNLRATCQKLRGRLGIQGETWEHPSLNTRPSIGVASEAGVDNAGTANGAQVDDVPGVRGHGRGWGE